MTHLTSLKTSNFKVILSHNHISALKNHLIAGFPNEQCGFLFGIRNSSHHKITKIMPVNNIKIGNQKRRFEIDPLDYMKAERYALENEVDLIGIYHSHPLHPATPSIHDHKQALETLSYIIMSINENKMLDLKSWRLNHQQVFEEEILTIK